MAGGGKETLILTDYENIYQTFLRIRNTPGLAELIYASNKDIQDILTNLKNYVFTETDNYEGKFGAKNKGQFTDNKLAIKVYKAMGGIMLSEGTNPPGKNPIESVDNYFRKLGKNTGIDTSNKGNENKVREVSKSREAFY